MNPKLLYSQGIGTGKICLVKGPLLVRFMVTQATEVLLRDISGGFLAVLCLSSLYSV